MIKKQKGTPKKTLKELLGEFVQELSTKKDVIEEKQFKLEDQATEYQNAIDHLDEAIECLDRIENYHSV